MEKIKPFGSTALLLLLFSTVFVSNAAAANSSEMKLSDFTSGSNPIDGIGDAKPLMLEVVAIVVGFFLSQKAGRPRLFRARMEAVNFPY